jgi:ribonuclease BN (tRNA processing enzyme)
VRITVLGKSPSWQDAGGACSGYLVEDGASCLLLDCGSSVFSQLRRVRDYVDVDAIVVSHMHADHFLDLIPFAHALTYAPRQQRAAGNGSPCSLGSPGDGGPARPRLLVPPGAIAMLRFLAEAGGQPRLFDAAFALREYDVAEVVEVGDLRVRLQPVPHYIPTNAIEVSRADRDARFTYGADHRPTDALREFAAATDLLMLEATLTQPEAHEPRGHMTPAEAGAVAAGCDAGRLVLTHISDELDYDWALAQAARSYAGPIEIARGGGVYEV